MTIKDSLLQILHKKISEDPRQLNRDSRVVLPLPDKNNPDTNKTELRVVSPLQDRNDPERNKRAMLACGACFNVKYEMKSMFRQVKTGKSSVKDAVIAGGLDVKSHRNEQKNPDSAYFESTGTLNKNKKGENDLAYFGNVSTREMLDNFIDVQTTDEGRQIAKFQKEQTVAVIEALHQLKDGQVLYNFAPKRLKVEEGIAIQHFTKKGDQLSMGIRLLPGGTTEKQAGELMNRVAINRQEKQLGSSRSLLFQAVVGEAKNTVSLKTDLESIVKDVIRQNHLRSVSQQELIRPYDSLITHRREDLSRSYYYQPKTDMVSPVLSLMFPWLNADRPTKKTGKTLYETPIFRKNEPVRKEKPVEATSKVEDNKKTSKEYSKKEGFRSRLIVVSPLETKETKKETRSTKEKSSARKATAGFYQENRKTKEARHQEWQKSAETAREERESKYQTSSDKDKNDILRIKLGLSTPRRKMRILAGGLALGKIKSGEIRNSKQKEKGVGKDGLSRESRPEEVVLYRITQEEKRKAEVTINLSTTKGTVVVYAEQTPRETSRQKPIRKKTDRVFLEDHLLKESLGRSKPIGSTIERPAIVKVVLPQPVVKEKTPLFLKPEQSIVRQRSGTVLPETRDKKSGVIKAVKKAAASLSKEAPINNQPAVTVNIKKDELPQIKPTVVLEMKPVLETTPIALPSLQIIPPVNQENQAIFETDKYIFDKRPHVVYGIIETGNHTINHNEENQLSLQNNEGSQKEGEYYSIEEGKKEQLINSLSDRITTVYSISKKSQEKESSQPLVQVKAGKQVENKTIGYVPKLTIISPEPLWFEVLPVNEPKAVKALPNGRKFKIYNRLMTRLIFNPEKPVLFHLSQSLRNVIKQFFNGQQPIINRPACLPDMLY